MTKGLPTRLTNEKISLDQDYPLAKAGEELTVEKAKILRLLGHKMAEFKLTIIAGWTKAHGYAKYQ